MKRIIHKLMCSNTLSTQYNGIGILYIYILSHVCSYIHIYENVIFHEYIRTSQVPLTMEPFGTQSSSKFHYFGGGWGVTVFDLVENPKLNPNNNCH